MVPETHVDDISAIRLLDEPVRRRLYEWVVAQGRPVGRDEAASALGIGRPLVAFHLERLADSSLLESAYRRLNERRGPGAGRPARVYWRGKREFKVSLPERRYDRAAELFASALERLGSDKAQAPLHDIAEDLGERLGAEAQGETGQARLLNVLETSGYEPATDADGTIRLRNCPFHALVEDHRQLVCGANLAMARGIVEAAGAAAQLEPVLDPQPGYCCVAFQPE